MTAEQYWDGDFTLVSSYLEGHKLALQRKYENDNWNAWLQGRYTYEALGVALSGIFSKHSSAKYPDKPYEMQNDERKEKRKSKPKDKTEFYKSWDELAEQYEGKEDMSCLYRLMNLS